jgi:hypothetical protein
MGHMRHMLETPAVLEDFRVDAADLHDDVVTGYDHDRDLVDHSWQHYERPIWSQKLDYPDIRPAVGHVLVRSDKVRHSELGPEGEQPQKCWCFAPSVEAGWPAPVGFGHWSQLGTTA